MASCNLNLTFIVLFSILVSASLSSVDHQESVIRFLAITGNRMSASLKYPTGFMIIVIS